MLFKNTIFSLLCLFPQPKNVANILTYHTISDSKVYNGVSPQSFKEQMQLLRQRFNPVSLQELSQMYENGIIKPKTVSVTLDDGFMDSYTHAFPILKKFKIPATIFIETCHIGLESENQKMMFPMMGKAELKKLSQTKLVSIQPHTVHHPRLTKISDNEIFVELVQSKNYLEKLLNVECYHFAYPYGMQDKRVQKVVHKTGIKYAYTTKEGFIKSTDEPLSLNRNSMNRTISLKQFEFICLFGKPTLRRLTRSDANYR